MNEFNADFYSVIATTLAVLSIGPMFGVAWPVRTRGNRIDRDWRSALATVFVCSLVGMLTLFAALMALAMQVALPWWARVLMVLVVCFLALFNMVALVDSHMHRAASGLERWEAEQGVQKGSTGPTRLLAERR
ncbi:hypothetical protein [Brevibacterium aurantiacum]|uniref:Uncharacterized protein n=1 Tax=Brevibacterium aurantiacum TaxID=273384 RepID=A0A2A3YZT5_BREAU|nr:hypothetical protein [Brevibacterium aurantiacum]PCC44743.1 hypothetical protein CIK65_00850 [Brevibacterium aurantiacum]